MRFRSTGNFMGGATLPTGWECELSLAGRARCGRLGVVFANAVDVNLTRLHPWVCHECAMFLEHDDKQKKLRKTAGA